MSQVPTASTWAVDARGVSKRYGARQALVAVDLQVARGSVHGLLGPNGAGKTTLLAALLGLVRPDAGTLSVLGRAVSRSGVLGHPGLAGMVESPRFYPYLSARRNLEMLAAYDGGGAPARVADSLDRVGLAGRAGQKVGGLSFGLRQRLGIAAALLRDPSILVLDEPTTGLDPAARHDLRGLVLGLASAGLTVLLSSHDLAEVDAVCSHATVLREGRVVHAGDLDGLRARAPAAQHRLHTSDDTAAAALARRIGLAAEPVERPSDGDPAGGLRVRTNDLDAYVLALGDARIAVRSLARESEPLAAVFLDLTGRP